MSERKKNSRKSKKTLREEILEKLDGDYSTREVSVMTRLSKEYVEILDTLVKLKLFKSRSETVAAMVMNTISAEREMFEELKRQAEIIDDVSDKIKDIALKALKG